MIDMADELLAGIQARLHAAIKAMEQTTCDVKANYRYIRDVQPLFGYAKKLRKQNKALSELIEADRTKLGQAVIGLDGAIAARSWLMEGRGPYEWDDDRYRAEFAEAIGAILDALKPIRQVASSFAGCPETTEAVAQARVDLKAECDRLRARVAELEAAS